MTRASAPILVLSLAACATAPTVTPKESEAFRARSAVKKAMRILDKEPSAAADLFAEAYAIEASAALAYDLAYARERSGDLSSGEAGYLAARELLREQGEDRADPRLEASILGNLARVKLHRGDAAGAAEAAEELARKHGPDAAAWTRAALLRRAARQRLEARSDARTALTIDPQSAAALAAAALAELDAGNVAAAALILARAPDSEPLVLYARAEREAALGHDGDALVLLERARKLSPRSAGPRVRAAQILLDNADGKGAAEALAGLDDPASLTLRGVALRVAGDLAGAQSSYEAALARDADRPETLFDLALLYRDGLRKPALALETFRRYLAVEGRSLRRADEAKAAVKDLERGK